MFVIAERSDTDDDTYASIMVGNYTDYSRISSRRMAYKECR